MTWGIGDRVWYIDSLEQPVFGIVSKINKKKKYAVVKSKYGENDVDFGCLKSIESEFGDFGRLNQ